MSNTRERIEILRRLIAQRIVVLDGATGTSIQGMNLHAGYFGGPSLDGCNENLVVTSPDKISELHRSFLEAGADIIVGSHAHVLLGGGYLGSAYVDYGLGNFAFYNTPAPTNESGSLIVTATGRRVDGEHRDDGRARAFQRRGRGRRPAPVRPPRRAPRPRGR